jgi:hypothetical protein
LGGFPPPSHSNRQSNIHMNGNSLIKIGPLSRCKFSSVLGDYPSRRRKLEPRDQVRILDVGAFENKFPDAVGRMSSARRTHAQRF